MHRSLIWLLLVGWLAAAVSASAATGRLIKVLPQLLDLKGQNSRSPSLYERDAYQAYLRQHTNQISGLKVNIQWKIKGKPAGPIKLRVEMRGIVHGETPEELVLEKLVEPGGRFSHWTGILVNREEYGKLVEITAWRVTLWEADQLLGEQQSFLW
jgi:hypothetical protein